MLLAVVWAALPTPLRAQSRGAGTFGSTPHRIEVKYAELDVHLNIPAGGPAIHDGVINVVNLQGQNIRQINANSEFTRIAELPQTEYNVHVWVPGYQPAVLRIDVDSSLIKLEFQLQPPAEEDAAMASHMATLPSKAQKEMGKAMAALRDKEPAKALPHLEALERLAPNSAEASYLHGTYAFDTNDVQHAKTYWKRTLELDPKHLRALFSLSEIALQEKSTEEALQLSRRAVDADPSSWRAHAMLASALSQHEDYAEAVIQAQRAVDLGHAQAATIEPFLAELLAREGQKDRAITVLNSYLHDHPRDDAAQKELASVTSGELAPAGTEIKDTAVAVAAAELPAVTNWLPPDVDEKMPPVEATGAGATCDVNAVISGVGQRIQEFVGNVERYTATESLYHESINKWGNAAYTEARKFNYVASIEEMRPGYFDVQEYRGVKGAEAEFPEGIATLGLPGMALLFHPDNAPNFDMVCEGLTRWDGVPVWQIHFRQRPDRPNTMRSYRAGTEGTLRTVAMKGRAWINADTYQLVRLETDLIAPMPEIQLQADHTIIEYGPVHFQSGTTELWLPTSGEVFFQWRNHRIHRRHSFDKYLLFSVDDKQKIFAPHGAEKTTASLTEKLADGATGSTGAATPNAAIGPEGALLSPQSPRVPPHN
jgi:tetratricopeptide (TPR) repeat protein